MSDNKFINPFRFVAGSKALLFGWGIMLVASVIAWKSNTHFDGVLEAAPDTLVIVDDLPAIFSRVGILSCFTEAIFSSRK